MNHTPEPWELHTGGKITGKIDAPWGEEVVVVAEINGPNRVDLIYMRNANRKRIIACVNACQGIPDPETTVPEAAAALRELIAYIEAQDSKGVKCHPFAEQVMPARAVLAKLEGGAK